MSLERSSVIPALSSRSVELRPLLPSDGEWCYALMCGPAGARWRYRGRTPSPEVVASEMWNSVFAQYVVLSRDSEERLGLVGLYNVSIEAGRAHAFAVAQPNYSALVVQGFGHMCSWAFDQFSLQRIYLETAEFNVESFASLGDIAVVEGRLRNYELWQGRYWDCFIMSISAQAFRERFGLLLENLRASAPPGGASRKDFEEACGELWPFDSLGATEILCVLEELCQRQLDPGILIGLDASSPDDAARILLGRAGYSMASDT